MTLLVIIATIYYVLLNSKEILSRQIINLNFRANKEETNFVREVYKPDHFATLGFRFKQDRIEACIKLRKHLQKIARQIKCHLFWVAYYDNQPLRGLDGEDYIHFHVFVEIERRKGIKFSPRGTGLSLSRVNALGALLGGCNWRYGTSVVMEYDPNRYGIEYSRLKHQGAILDISCPEMKSCWNSKTKVIDCLYSRFRSRFWSRS